MYYLHVKGPSMLCIISWVQLTVFHISYKVVHSVIDSYWEMEREREQQINLK